MRIDGPEQGVQQRVEVAVRDGHVRRPSDGARRVDPEQPLPRRRVPALDADRVDRAVGLVLGHEHPGDQLRAAGHLGRVRAGPGQAHRDHAVQAPALREGLTGHDVPVVQQGVVGHGERGGRRPAGPLPPGEVPRVAAQHEPEAQREVLALLELGGVPTGGHGSSVGGQQEARRGSVLRLRASEANGAQKSQSSSSVSTALPMT